MKVMTGNLTGTYRVRALRSAFADAHSVLPRTRDRGELRRHSLKLRFWPDQSKEHNGVVMDLDWCFIKALAGKKIGELRIHDTIGGCDNLRVIFFVAPQSKNPEEMPMIWVLGVMQKKRDDFSKANLVTFEARRQVVLERFYEGKF